MALFRRKSPATATGSGPMGRMPPIVEPSKTEQWAQSARRSRPADEHWSVTRVLSYLEVLPADRCDSPLYLGVTGRPAILLCLSRQMGVHFDGLGELIRGKGATLFLQGHRLGRYGMVRAVLELPVYELIFETPLTLAHGDVQEFISAGYRNEAIELHVARVNSPQPLHLVCQADGIRPVVDAVLDAVDGLAHPTRPAEQAAPVAALEAKFPDISAGLHRRSAIQLTVTGQADGVLRASTVN